MQPRERERWEVSGPGAFLTVGEASVQTLGADRYLVAWPGGEQTVEDLDRARELAQYVATSRSLSACVRCDTEAELAGRGELPEGRPASIVLMS